MVSFPTGLEAAAHAKHYPSLTPLDVLEQTPGPVRTWALPRAEESDELRMPFRHEVAVLAWTLSTNPGLSNRTAQAFLQRVSNVLEDAVTDAYARVPLPAEAAAETTSPALPNFGAVPLQGKRNLARALMLHDLEGVAVRVLRGDPLNAGVARAGSSACALSSDALPLHDYRAARRMLDAAMTAAAAVATARSGAQPAAARLAHGVGRASVSALGLHAGQMSDVLALAAQTAAANAAGGSGVVAQLAGDGGWQLHELHLAAAEAAAAQARAEDCLNPETVIMTAAFLHRDRPFTEADAVALPAYCGSGLLLDTDTAAHCDDVDDGSFLHVRKQH